MGDIISRLLIHLLTLFDRIALIPDKDVVSCQSGRPFWSHSVNTLHHGPVNVVIEACPGFGRLAAFRRKPEIYAGVDPDLIALFQQVADLRHQRLARFRFSPDVQVVERIKTQNARVFAAAMRRAKNLTAEITRNAADHALNLRQPVFVLFFGAGFESYA
jgi:hypothetical protein